MQHNSVNGLVASGAVDELYTILLDTSRIHVGKGLEEMLRLRIHRRRHSHRVLVFSVEVVIIG